MLWLALHFPQLPLEVFQRASALPGINVVSSGGSQPRVLIASAAAIQHGIHPGMSFSAAYALAPELNVLERNERLETQTLESLALWAEQFTPTIAIAHPQTSNTKTPLPADSLLLEIGGCLKLFGGLEALTQKVIEQISALGFDTVCAVAPTPSGALLLARSGLELHLTTLAQLREQLIRLPIENLDAPAATLTTLSRLGVRTVGECLQLPRDGLARRFDQTLLDDLDRALGHLPDPRAPFIPPPRFASRLVPPVPIPDVEALLFGVKRLINECTGFLTGRQAGATRLLLKLEHEDYPITQVRIELSMPTRDAAHLTVLARERLSRITLPQAVEAFSLELEESMQLAPSNFSFFTPREATTENRIALVERLRARLGSEAVHGLALVPAHRPELAFKETEPGTQNVTAPHAPRPLWLLPTPRPLLKDDHGPRLDGPLKLLSGPERIESGWWDDGDVQRDYFVAANPEGARFWIYRDYDPAASMAQAQWFLHGVFA